MLCYIALDKKKTKMNLWSGPCGAVAVFTTTGTHSSSEGQCGGSRLEQGMLLQPQILPLHPQFGRQQNFSLRIIYLLGLLFSVVVDTKNQRKRS